MGLGLVRSSTVHPGREGPRRVCIPGGRCLGDTDGAQAKCMGAPGPSGASAVASGALRADDAREPVSRGPQHVPALRLGAGRAVQARLGGHSAPVARPCSGGMRPAVTSAVPLCLLAVRISSPGLGHCGPVCPSEQFASQQFCTFLATKCFKVRKSPSEPFPSVCSHSVLLLLIPNIRLVT